MMLLLRTFSLFLVLFFGQIAAHETHPRGCYVGELQERWNFPSDHLPIGMSYKNHDFASWNVLDTECIDWVIEKDSQGLCRSLIGKSHIYLPDSPLTLRDRYVVETILSMINHPDYPKHILALQECGAPFIEELKNSLSEDFLLLTEGEYALIVDQNHFEVLSVDMVYPFTSDPKRAIQIVQLFDKQSKERLRIINTHIPGDPAKPCRHEFATYLAETFDATWLTIALGDMNFNEREMGEALHEAFSGEENPFSLYAPYCTNITPYLFISKSIDHFIISDKCITPRTPEEILIGLSKALDLLEIKTSCIIPLPC